MREALSIILTAALIVSICGIIIGGYAVCEVQLRQIPAHVMGGTNPPILSSRTP